MKESWTEARTALGTELEQMKEVNKRIRLDSQQLLQTRRLALERKDPDIARLCAQTQPGLKLGFVTSEGAIMMRNTVATAELFEELTALVEKVYESDCLRAHHYREVQAKSKEVKAALNKAVQELGWKDFDTLIFHKTMFAGSIVAVAGGVGLMATILSSSTIGAAIAGTGVISTAAVAGIATGGIAIAIGIVVLAIGAGLTARNESWSAEFKDLVMKAFDELLSTSQALLSHKKSLTAVEQALKSLEVP